MKGGKLFTRRLLLRDIAESDADLIVKWRSDPEVYKFFRSPHPLTRQEHLRWYEEQYLTDKNRHVWMALRAKDGVPVGTFGLARLESSADEAEVSYLVAPKAQGMGYAHEAAEVLLEWAVKEWKAKAVSAEIHCENAPSIRFAESMGFVKMDVRGNFIVYKRLV